jgi:hypothetical protein
MACRVVGWLSRALQVRARCGWSYSCVAMLAWMLISSGPASAAVIFDQTLNGTSAVTGKQLSARVVFDVSDSDLKITATNTGDAAEAPADVVSGIFFDLNQPQTLHAGAVDFTTKTGSNQDHLLNSSGSPPLGKHWQFRQLTTPIASQDYGIAASGLGGTFSHANFVTPGDALQGVDYGIVDGLGARPNGGLKVPLVSRSLTFTLTGVNSGGTPLGVEGVRVQYGSNLTEPSLAFGTAVPEPATISLVCLCAGASLARRDRRA